MGEQESKAVRGDREKNVHVFDDYLDWPVGRCGRHMIAAILCYDKKKQ